MPYFFQVPFGVSGDKTAVPVPVQVDGSISYTEGYGPNYQLPRATDPAALTIERNKFNQLYYAITSNIQQYQTHGTPEFIASSDNGGAAYPYAKYARVRYDNGAEIADYLSLVDSNTALPIVTTNWLKLRSDPAFLGVAQTFTEVQTIAASGIPLIINSTNSTVAKIMMTDNGTPRGFIGSSSGYFLAAIATDGTTVMGGWNNSGHLVPGASASYDLGATSFLWRNVLANRITVTGSTVPTNGIYLPASNTPAIAVDSAIGVAFGSGSIGANISQKHIIPAVASDTFCLLLSPQTISYKSFDGTNTFSGLIQSVVSTAPLGYAFGAGGAVTQATSKNTGVTLNVPTGRVTMNAAALAANTSVQFVMTNSSISSTDIIVVNHQSGGSFGNYSVQGRCATGQATIELTNKTAGSLSDAVAIAFAVIKGATS
jgi:hypothetical protein